MAKEKLITNAQLKKRLNDLERDEYIYLITEIAQSCPQAREYLTVKFADNENINEILEKYKEKVEHEFFPKRGYGRLNLREAKKAISDFKKICSDKSMAIDLMLFYVENCVKFTDSYGDINESFYNSAISVYSQVIKEINSNDIEIYTIFADRLKSAAENACHGWGFYDDMIALYYEISWLDE
ncbi:MAG: DUF6155 family protein [Oscillospiraceae bacterium]|nr:DUF6155 family protein [Oscillospiraceae bacterium]